VRLSMGTTDAEISLKAYVLSDPVPT